MSPLASFGGLIWALGMFWAWLAGDLIIGAAWWAAGFGLLSALVAPLPWAALALAAALFWGWPRRGPGRSGWALFSGLLLPMALLLAWRTRYAYFPEALPGTMGSWAGLASLVALMLAYPALAFAEQPEDALGPLAWGQAGWVLLALCLPGPAPSVGALGLILQQALLRSPLDLALRVGAKPAPWIVLLALLGLAGAPPFGAFSAFFHAFIPLMGVGDGVGSMSAKLFSGPGLLAAVCVLALVYQSAAFGYFYWQRVLRQGPEGKPVPLLALGLALALSVLVGLWPKGVNQVLFNIVDHSLKGNPW